jgi:hypothetical protein
LLSRSATELAKKQGRRLKKNTLPLHKSKERQPEFTGERDDIEVSRPPLHGCMTNRARRKQGTSQGEARRREQGG